VAARLLHAPPPLVARGFTRLRKERLETGGSSLASSPLPFLAGAEDHHHLQQEQNTQTAVDFKFFCFLFTDLFSFSSSPFWICFSLQICSFLFLSHSSLSQVAARPQGGAGC